MGLPVPMEPLASSTLQVFAKASTKTAGSRAMTGEMVLKNDLTAIADDGPPVAFLQYIMQICILFTSLTLTQRFLDVFIVAVERKTTTVVNADKHASKYCT